MAKRKGKKKPADAATGAVELDRLRAAASNINEQLDLEPALPVGDPEEITAALVAEGTKGDGFYEGDELEEDTLAVLAELGVTVNPGDAPDEDEDPAPAKPAKAAKAGKGKGKAAPKQTAAEKKAEKAAAAAEKKAAAEEKKEKAAAKKARDARMSRKEAVFSVLEKLGRKKITAEELEAASTELMVAKNGEAGSSARQICTHTLQALENWDVMSVNDDGAYSFPKK